MSFHEIFNQLFDQSGTPQTLSTGIRSLDKLIDDGFGAELIVVSGRPNHGSTSFLLNLMLNFSYYQEYKGMFIAPRSDQRHMTKQLISIIEDSVKPLDEWDEDILVDRVADIKRLFQQKVIVAYDFDSLDAVLTKAKSAKVSYLIIDDFFSIVSQPYLASKNYADFYQKLNRFIKETKIPVFVAMMTSASASKRSAIQLPFLVDIYNSDILLPFVHKVFLLYREIAAGITISEDGDSTENRLEVNLAMNTLGHTGTLLLRKKDSGRVEEW
ncbi:MAG: DnaB-like helicase C-terminal domain-containing protein [Mongoliitalea sp.]